MYITNLNCKIMSISDEILDVHACRICLDSSCIDTVTLDDQSGWLHLFEYCFGIPLSIQDKPRSLCQQCANEVRNYSKFKELCFKSDKLWKSLSSGKCSTKKLGPKNLFKDEVCDYKQNENTDKINYTCIDEFNRDLSNFDNNLNNLVTISIKTESLKNETSQHKIPSTEITNEKDNESPKTNTFLQYNPERNNKGTSEQTVRSQAETHDLLRVNNLFTCKTCQRSYGSKLWYLKHLKLCKVKKIKQSATYQNQDQKFGIKINLQNSNGTLKLIKSTKIERDIVQFCGVCKFSSKNDGDVTKHLNGHWINNDLQCTLCAFIGKDKAAVAAHRYDHYTAKTCSFVCHICQKKTKSQLTLQFHYRKVHLDKIGGLCSHPQCDKSYASWKLWKRHEKLHNHPGYICDLCGQKYRYKHVIVEHLSNHVNPTTHVCDVCGKTFLRLRNLRVHIENVHDKSDPLKCSHCKRMFKNQHYLRLHQKLLAREKIWKCEFCPLEYPNLSSLKSHLRSHSEERPHCCHICGSRYKAKSQLAIHIRNHTGDRPYKCVVCAKTYKSAQLLRRHNMIHTGVMPHKCLHCEKMFLCKKRMLKHCSTCQKTPNVNT